MTEEKKTAAKIVVVGAGIIGSSIAYFLSQRDGVAASLTIVERTGVACAASGKSGGFLAKTWCDSGPVRQLARASFALHAELGAKWGDTTGYRKVDTIGVSVKEKKKAETKKTEKKHEDGVPAFVDGRVSDVREMANTENSAQVTPAKLTNAFIQAATKAGATLLSGNVVGVVLTDGCVKGVKLANGQSLPADVVVVACGPWSFECASWFPSSPAKKALAAICGQKAHSIIVRPKEGITVSATAIFIDFRAADGTEDHPEIYPRSDGTVYCCGFSEDPEQPPSDAAEVKVTEGACEKLRKAVSLVSSAVSADNAKLETEQACYLPMADDGLPIISAITGVKGAFIATGHTCWYSRFCVIHTFARGVLNGPATGQALCELILDGKSSIDLSPFDLQRFLRRKGGL